jgi:hypothetical protein
MLIWVVSLVVRPSATALIISSFQASSLFVWPVVYLVTLLAIAGVWKLYPARVALTLLVVALGLKVWDTSPLWNHLRHDVLTQPDRLPERQAVLAVAGPGIRVNFVPTYLCAFVEPMDPDAREASLAQLSDLQVLVSRFVRPTTSVHNSCMTATDIAALTARCDGERQAALTQLDTPGTMTIVLNDTPSEALLRAALLGHPGCSV